MKQAEMRERFPIGSLWRADNAWAGGDKGMIVRRVIRYEFGDPGAVVLARTEEYPDPVNFGFSDTYPLVVTKFMSSFKRMWSPNEVIDARRNLVGLEEELREAS